MATMADTQVERDLPEFHIVVRRPNHKGPIAPYRMTLAVAFAMFVAGRELWHAVQSGTGYDDALIHAGAAAVFIWVLSGIVNSILTNGAPPSKPRPIADSE